jgi:hypothetical protein
MASKSDEKELAPTLASAEKAETSKAHQEKAYDPNWLKGTSADPDKKSKNNFSHPVYKKLSKINGRVNNMSMKELENSLAELDLETK